jgi:hypothetical protein
VDKAVASGDAQQVRDALDRVGTIREEDDYEWKHRRVIFEWATDRYPDLWPRVW